jgi:hypothetical protein
MVTGVKNQENEPKYPKNLGINFFLAPDSPLKLPYIRYVPLSSDWSGPVRRHLCSLIFGNNPQRTAGAIIRLIKLKSVVGDIGVDLVGSSLRVCLVNGRAVCHILHDQVDLPPLIATTRSNRYTSLDYDSSFWNLRCP